MTKHKKGKQDKGPAELQYVCPRCGGHACAVLRDLPDAVLPEADILDMVLRRLVRCEECGQQSVAREPK